MNIAALKAKYGMQPEDKLQLSFLQDDQGKRAIDPKTNQPTNWAKHWDNDNRRAILMHADTVQKIKDNPLFANLGVKETAMVSKAKGDKPGQPYTQVTVINYTDPDMEV